MGGKNCEPFEYFLKHILTESLVFVLYLNFHQIPQESNGLVFSDRWKFLILDCSLDVIDYDFDGVLVVILDMLGDKLHGLSVFVLAFLFKAS